MRKGVFLTLFFVVLGITLSGQTTRVRLKQLELAPDTLFRYVIIADTSTQVAEWAKLDSLGFGAGTTLYLRGDAGTLSTLTDGDTIDIKTGSGLSTWGKTPDQILITLDSTGVTAGTYNFATVTVNEQGRITLITAGSEVDGSITNEGMLGVAAGGANSATIYTNTSGNVGTSIAGGWGVAISETTSANGGTVTIAADSSQVATQYDISGLHTGSLTSGRIPRATGTYSLSDGVLRDDGSLLALGGVTVSGYSFYDYSTSAWRLPVGTTAQRPTGQAGAIRYNTTVGLPEFHNGTRWGYIPPASGVLTSTRVPFVDSNGQLTDDADFVWDATNNRLGISVTPLYDLHIRRGVNNFVIASVENSTNSTASRAALQIASKNTTDYIYLVGQSFSPAYTTSAWGGTYTANGAQLGRYSITTDGKMIFYNATSGGTLANNPIEFHINNAATFSASTLAATITNTQIVTKNITSQNGWLLYDDAVPSLSVYSQSTSANRGYNAFQHSDNNNGIGFLFNKSRGTKASPTAAQANDAIGALAFRAYDGSSYVSDVAYVNAFASGAISAGITPISIGFVAGQSTSYDVDFLMHSGGNVGIGASGNGNFTTSVNTPPRLLSVYGEARITDLTTDTPTSIVGHDADGDLGSITVGSGLSLSGGTLTATGTGSMSSWTLAGTSGTPQTVSDGQTATIAAGYGVTTTAAATRTVTVAADTTKLATPYDLSQIATIYNSNGSINVARTIDLDYTTGSFNLAWDNGAGNTREFTLGDGASTATAQDGLWYADYAGTNAGEFQVTDALAYLAVATGATQSSVQLTNSTVETATTTETHTLTATGAANWSFGSGTKITFINPGYVGINDTSPEALLDVNGVTKTNQIVGQGNNPTIATNANAGTGRSAALTTAQSSDLAGRGYLTTGTTLTAGEWFTMTWGTAYSVAPIVQIQCENANCATLMPYLYVVPTTTGVSVGVNVTGASYESKTYEFNYIVIGGK